MKNKKPRTLLKNSELQSATRRMRNKQIKTCCYHLQSNCPGKLHHKLTQCGQQMEKHQWEISKSKGKSLHSLFIYPGRGSGNQNSVILGLVCITYVYLCCMNLNINGIAFKISLCDVAAFLPLLFCPSGIKAERKARQGSFIL